MQQATGLPPGVSEFDGCTRSRNGLATALLDRLQMVIRLTRKFADRIDGVDVSGYKVGDVIHLPFRAAKLLIAEGWAELIDRRGHRRGAARV